MSKYQAGFHERSEGDAYYHAFVKTGGKTFEHKAETADAAMEGAKAKAEAGDDSAPEVP